MKYDVYLRASKRFTLINSLINNCLKNFFFNASSLKANYVLMVEELVRINKANYICRSASNLLRSRIALSFNSHCYQVQRKTPNKHTQLQSGCKKAVNNKTV